MKERKKDKDPKERRRKSGVAAKRASKVSPPSTTAEAVSSAQPPSANSPTTTPTTLPPVQVPPGYHERLQNEKAKKRRSKSHVLDEINRTMKRGTAFRMRKSKQADDWLKNWMTHEQTTQVGVIAGSLSFGQPFPQKEKHG